MQPGGQLSTTTTVENFPGFPEGITGPELMGAMGTQAEKFGAEMVRREITSVDFGDDDLRVFTSDGEYRARAIVIASGAFARLLGLEAEKRLMGRGVSVCATCDGFFFQEKEIAVVGGGDTALEDASFLTRFASKVTVIHRRDELRASKTLQDRAFLNKKIDFLWDTIVVDIIGTETEGVTGLKLRNVKTGEEADFDCQGVFIAIGHQPNTEPFRGHLDMDDEGYIITRSGTQTSAKGVFAGGDVVDKIYRQAITAAGSGCMAALDAQRFLEGT
jgi:thioredoxin reductase (NADPH)